MTVALLAGLAPALTATVAAAPVTTTFTYGGGAVAIPDGLGAEVAGATASATVTSSGLVGTVVDVDLRIDGSACNTTNGSTTVGIDHTFVGDLRLSLTSPDGTTISLVNRLSNGGGGNSGNNFCQTRLDDEAGTAIQSQLAAAAPFTGSFRPATSLSAFDGETSNGTWTLTAQDFFIGDTGSIRAFSLIITTNPGAAVGATKTVTGTFEEGGTVTYTVVATNEGTTTNPDDLGNELVDVLPPELTLVAATSTAGTTVANIGTNTVTWNGTLAPAATVTVTITATVDAGTENVPVSNQATVNFDADDDGTNESSALSDDPGVGGAADPTVFTVAADPPTVTVEQAISQADPTTSSAILFTAVFSEPVTGFSDSDVTLSGTAGATTVVVSGAGPTYNLTVSGMTAGGTVIVTIPAGGATDAAGNPNQASTSTDNTVTFLLPVNAPPPPPPPPSTTITLEASAATITWGGSVTLTASFGTGGASRTFQLLASRDNITFSPIATLTTDASGRAALTYRPATNRYYRASFGGATDLGSSVSNTARVVVRQIGILRPTNVGATRSIARNTAVRFTTTVRPSRPELTRATVSFFFYQRIRGVLTLVARPEVTIDAVGRASWTWTFSKPGDWYVRSVANPTPENANSVMTPLERYVVR